MKKKLCVLILLIVMSTVSFAQQINISSLIVKPVLPSNVSQWDPTAVNGVATGTADTDGVRMAINIVRNGNSFVCGTTYENAMEMAGFATKVIRTSDVTGALGDCILPAGEYRLCIQFYSAGLPDAYEACRDFTVAGPIVQPGQQQTSVEYSVPNLMAPADGSSIKAKDAKNPITLRWTPVVPPPPVNDINYTIRIYEILSGQKPEQALRGNQPILDLDLKGLTQTRWLMPSGTENIENRKFVWNVQATNNEGKPYGKNNGMSENYIFDRWGNLLQEDPKPEVLQPGTYQVEADNAKCLPICKSIIDKVTCDGDRILIKGHIEIPMSNTAVVNSISITSIKQNSGNSISTSYGALPKVLTGSGNGQANAFEFYIDKKSCGQDLVIEYDMNSICGKNKVEDKSLEKSQVKKGRIVIAGRDIVCCGENHEAACLNDPVINGNFMLGSVAGPMPSGQVASWSMAYSNTASGKPIVNNSAGQGCLDTGFVILNGNNTTGNAITQSLANGNKIVAGKRYTFYVSVRFVQGQTLDYGKIRLIAYNGTLPTVGQHPGPSTDVAIIGRSGKVHDCGDWSIVEFPVWKANKNFDKIAINAFTNDNNLSKVYIDNISACETTQSDCNELQISGEGKPIAPAGYTGPMPAGPCQAEEEMESNFNGSLVDLYGYDGTPAMYSDANGDECANIGGTLPEEFQTYDCNSSLTPAEEGFNCNQIDAILNTDLSGIKEPKITYIPIAPLSTNPPQCPKLSVGDQYSMVFGGRDIIFIHGLMIEHITDRTTHNHPGAQADWPDKSEFYGNGYYKRVAIENWKHHIQHFLRGKGRKNRYLLVTYNSSQRAEFAIQSVMNQIRDAMEYGTDVQAEPGDPRGKSCFGKDYVLISHSTGGLIGDLVLAKANKSKTDPVEQQKYGNVGFISDRCKTHIAMHGAMGGSNLATMAVSIAGSYVVANFGMRAIVAEALGGHTLGSTILTSVLVDLCPAVTYYKWRWDLDDVPVPVLTIAGGHPASFTGPLVHILPGIDDGVESMESASGRNKPLISPISQFTTAWPPRVYDMGIQENRAKGFYRDSRRGFDRFGIASSKNLSQTGMVEPKYSVYYIHPQHHNHYTFIQSTKEHLQPATNAYFGLNNYYNTLHGDVNNEEELVTDMDSPPLYASGLINPAIRDRMGETVAGLPKWYPNLRYKKGRFYIVWKKFWIWKRTYHKLDGDEYDMDFAYKYILTP